MPTSVSFQFVIVLLCSTYSMVLAQHIYTIAGTGIRGYIGDGGLATEARLNAPQGIFQDSSETIYIADSMNHRIRKIAPNGIISTIAGNGKPGHIGDGSLATQAQLDYPTDIVAPTPNTLLIADVGNHCIRHIAADNIITTIAGTTARGYAGDGGPALQARFNNPRGIAIGPTGVIYIADSMNHCIRKIDLDSTISTIAGNGNPGFSGDGNLALEAELNVPEKIYLDSSGCIYIADTGNNRIRKIDVHGIISTIAGNGNREAHIDTNATRKTALYNPQAIGLSDQLYIAASGNNCIYQLNNTSITATTACNGDRSFTGDNGPAQLATLNNPTDIHITGPMIYLADSGNHAIRLITDQQNVNSTQQGKSSIDFNADGTVQLTDFFQFSTQFGTTPNSANWDVQFDIIADGIIDFYDFWRFTEIYQRYAL